MLLFSHHLTVQVCCEIPSVTHSFDTFKLPTQKAHCRLGWGTHPDLSCAGAFHPTITEASGEEVVPTKAPRRVGQKFVSSLSARENSWICLTKETTAFVCWQAGSAGRVSGESLSLLVLYLIILWFWCFGYGGMSFFVQYFQKAPFCEVNKSNFSGAVFTQWGRRGQWGCEWGCPHHKMGPHLVPWRQSWRSEWPEGDKFVTAANSSGGTTSALDAQGYQILAAVKTTLKWKQQLQRILCLCHFVRQLSELWLQGLALWSNLPRWMDIVSFSPWILHGTVNLLTYIFYAIKESSIIKLSAQECDDQWQPECIISATSYEALATSTEVICR